MKKVIVVVFKLFFVMIQVGSQILAALLEGTAKIAESVSKKFES